MARFGRCAPQADLTLDFDGTTVVLAKLANSEPGNSQLASDRATVTVQVGAKVGSGGAITNFAVNTDPASLDGVALVVVYSNPDSPLVTVAVLDGGPKQAGDQETVNFAPPSTREPLDSQPSCRSAADSTFRAWTVRLRWRHFLDRRRQQHPADELRQQCR